MSAAAKTLTAPVNRIIPFSLVDGPGSRCAVFLQGCNLACAYCHNPETQQLCDGCGTCVGGCPVGALALGGGRVTWDDDACVGCDACIRACPRRASPKVRWLDTREIFETVRSYQPFIRGVTVSGGECMLYPAWLRELFSLCRGAGLGCLVDSNGAVDFSAHGAVLDVCDGVMLDVKAWDARSFRRITGGGEVATMRGNLAYLAERGKIEELRIVVVDGWNDPEAAIAGIAETLGNRTRETRLKLIRFRRFGVIGPLSDAPSPTDGRMAELERLARSSGFGSVELR